MMNNYEPDYCVGKTYHKLNKQTETGNAWGDWDTEAFTAEDAAFGFIVMKNGATINLRSSWALNYIDAKEAVTLICGDKGGADMPAMGKPVSYTHLFQNGDKFGSYAGEHYLA